MKARAAKEVEGLEVVVKAGWVAQAGMGAGDLAGVAMVGWVVQGAGGWAEAETEGIVVHVLEAVRSEAEGVGGASSTAARAGWEVEVRVMAVGMGAGLVLEVGGVAMEVGMV